MPQIARIGECIPISAIDSGQAPPTRYHQLRCLALLLIQSKPPPVCLIIHRRSPGREGNHCQSRSHPALVHQVWGTLCSSFEAKGSWLWELMALYNIHLFILPSFATEIVKTASRQIILERFQGIAAQYFNRCVTAFDDAFGKEVFKFPVETRSGQADQPAEILLSSVDDP